MKSELINEDIAEQVMNEIGVCKEGTEIMLPKTKFRLLRIYKVRSAVANILKQEMLAAGGDVAVLAGTVNCAKPETDVLVIGNLTQYRILAKKMMAQAKIGIKDCKEVARVIENALDLKNF